MNTDNPIYVIPAQAGIHNTFALRAKSMDSRLRGNDKRYLITKERF